MQKQQDINSSLYKYLYDGLEVVHGVKIVESIYMQDFTSFTKWCVIDQLSNRLGIVPKQLYFLHCSIQKGLANAIDELDKLLDWTVPLFDEGQPIDIFDKTSHVVLGGMSVVNPSLSPVLEHAGGGMKRTLTFGLTYVK